MKHNYKEFITYSVLSIMRGNGEEGKWAARITDKHGIQDIYFIEPQKYCKRQSSP